MSATVSVSVESGSPLGGNPSPASPAPFLRSR